MTRSSPASAALALDVSTKLLENYRSVTPALGGGAIAVIASRSGPVIAGISSTNHGYLLVGDQASESGWSSIPLGTAILNGALAAMTDAAGNPHVFASDGKTLLHAYKTGPEPKDWSILQPVPGVAGCSSIVTLTNGNSSHVAAVTGGAVTYGTESAAAPGEFEWFSSVIKLVDPSGEHETFSKLKLFPGRAGAALIATSYVAPPGSLNSVNTALYEGNRANWSLSSIDEETLVDIGLSAIVNGDEVAVFSAWIDVLSVWSQANPGAAWADVSVEESQGFAITAFKPWVNPVSGRICGIAIAFDLQDTVGYGTPYLFEALTNPLEMNQWSITPLSGGEPGVVLPISQNWVNVPETNFAIIADPVTGLMRAFALDSKSDLCVMEQQATGWTPLLPTGHQASALYPINHPDGFTQVVAVGADGIYVLSYSATSSEWIRTDLELNLPDETAPYNCYSTEITVTDANGVLQPRTPTLLKCSDAMQARINGTMMSLDPESPIPVDTNIAGRITVETAIGSLNCPEILVRIESMEPDAWVSIVPQLEVQDTIRNATSSVENFLAQKDHNGNYVVTGPLRSEPLRAEQVALSIQRCSDLVASAGTHLSSTFGPLVRNRKPDRVRYVPPGETRTGRHLNYAAIAPVSWSLDFSSGAPVYRVLSDAEAAAAVQPLGLFGVDWGSVWNSIKNGVSDLVRVVVRVIVDPVKNVVTAIEASVTALIEGIQQVYSATVSLVEQVFDVIESIFTKIKTFFKELIDWLAFFFDWHDILLTKQAVKYLISQSYELFDGAMATQQQKLPNLLRGASTSLQNWYDQSRGPVGSSNALGARNDNPNPDYTTSGQDHNIVQSNLYDAISSGSISSRMTTVAATLQLELDSLISLLSQLEQQIVAQPAYASATQYIRSMIGKLTTDPDAFLDTAIDDIFGALVSLARVGLELTATVLENLIALLRKLVRLFASVLDWEIYIPVITPLYKFITGDTLTFGDVISLGAAVAITLTYKLAVGKVPFTESSLKTFKMDWAASSLLGRMGMGPQQHGIAPPPSTFDYAIGNIILFLSTSMGGVCDGIADAQAMAGDQGMEISIITAALDLITLIVEFPWAPFLTEPIHGDPDVISVDGLFAVSWLLDGVSSVIDVGTILKTRHKATFENWGPAVTTVIGLFQYAIYSGIIYLEVKDNEWDTVAKQTDIGSMLTYLPDVSKLLIQSNNEYAGIAQMAMDALGPIVGGILIFDANMDPKKHAFATIR